ncbi:Uncharacterized protein QTN25_006961 [Entamoeba marina]
MDISKTLLTSLYSLKNLENTPNPLRLSFGIVNLEENVEKDVDDIHRYILSAMINNYQHEEFYTDLIFQNRCSDPFTSIINIYDIPYSEIYSFNYAKIDMILIPCSSTPSNLGTFLNILSQFKQIPCFPILIVPKQSVLSDVEKIQGNCIIKYFPYNLYSFHFALIWLLTTRKPIITSTQLSSLFISFKNYLPTVYEESQQHTYISLHPMSCINSYNNFLLTIKNFIFNKPFLQMYEDYKSLLHETDGLSYDFFCNYSFMDQIDDVFNQILLPSYEWNDIPTPTDYTTYTSLLCENTNGFHISKENISSFKNILNGLSTNEKYMEKLTQFVFQQTIHSLPTIHIIVPIIKHFKYLLLSSVRPSKFINHYRPSFITVDNKKKVETKPTAFTPHTNRLLCSNLSNSKQITHHSLVNIMLFKNLTLLQEDNKHLDEILKSMGLQK